MTSKGKKRSEEKSERTQPRQGTPESPPREASNLESNPEHRHRSQRTDLLEGDPAGTAFSEEMGHTPTRE